VRRRSAEVKEVKEVKEVEEVKESEPLVREPREKPQAEG